MASPTASPSLPLAGKWFWACLCDPGGGYLVGWEKVERARSEGLPLKGYAQVI